jgi:alpha-mannosidase
MTYNAAEGCSAMISKLNGRCRFFVFLPLLFGCSILVQSAGAQHGAPVVQPGANLPPQSRAVIDTLASLGQLPAGTWKAHVGDMAHGEAVNLDDSSWQPVAISDKEPNEAVWFRQTFQVPDTLDGYDLTGARIWFQFHANANGPMPEILYFDGRRVALGEDLEPIVLLDGAHPGDKVVIAVKLLQTVDTKQFRGATLRIEFAEGRPNPDDLRQEFLSAAVLLPSLAPGDQSKMDTLNAAIRTVDLDALKAAEAGNPEARPQAQTKFDASLKTAQSQLEVLRPLLQTATFHVTGNSHIDAAWLWPWTETVDVVRRTFSTALQLMNEYPDYTYTQSAAAYNDWMAEKYPDMNAEIKQRIKEGRWEIVGGMWVEPDLNMPDGESLVRQLLVGKRWYKQAYGVDVRIGWNPDSFGYTWQLPQIYKKSGVDYFVTQKMMWNDTNQLPFKLFWWESPDGSKVLTYFPHDYGNGNLSPVRLSSDLEIARQQAPGMTEMMDLYGVGDHGGGPTRAMLDEGFHWTADDHVTPKYQFGTAQAFFSTVEKQIASNSPEWNYQSIAKGYQPPPDEAGNVSIPTWNSELYFEYHRGVMTTQANHKKNMRDAEEEVLNAEKWASLAWLDGQRYPGEEITEDWKKVLFNQFHDLASGSGIGVIYKDAQKDYDVVRWSTNEISADAFETEAARINTGTEAGIIPVVIWNSLGWDRTGDVTVKVQSSNSTGRSYAWAYGDQSAMVRPAQTLGTDPATGVSTVRIADVNVPAFGYTVVQLQTSTFRFLPPPTTHDSGSASELTLSGKNVRVSVDQSTGCITSIFDLESKHETLQKGACGNELQAFKDTPTRYDAWNIDPGTLDVPPALIHKADSVKEVTDSSGEQGIQVTRTWQSSKFVQTITLTRNDEIDVENDIDWHEKHILLKAAFPLAATNNFATYEIPYGEIERPTTRNNSWEQAQFEVPAMRWADLSGARPDGQVHGLSILNQDKYGYDAVGSVLRLTLLRAPTWPDPDADQGHHHFHYALYPHAGTWKEAMTVRHGWEYNYPLQAVVTTAHAGSLPAEHSFASVSPENVVLTAVKKAEDQNGLGVNGLILRVYEWAGKESTVEFHVPPGATSATVTNMMETPEGDALAVDGDVVKAPIHPYEILTVRVDYPGGGPKQ